MNLNSVLTLPQENPPTVACILITHNYTHYLKQCAESILNQTHPSDIFLVVDDSSTDNPEKVCKELNLVYERVDFENVCFTRNHAARKIPPVDWLLFVDADNWLEPDYIEQMLKHTADPRVGIVYPKILRFGDSRGERVTPKDNCRYDLLHNQNYIESCSLIRKSAFDMAGWWNPEIDTCMDWNLWMRMTALGWQAVKSQAKLHYRVHKGMMSADRFARRIHIDTMRKSYTVTLFTPFCGRDWMLDRYFKFLETQAFNHNRIKLCFYDNSCNPEFEKRLRQFLSQCDYPQTQYIRDDSKCFDGITQQEFAGGDASVRVQREATVHRQLTRIYNRMTSETTTDLIWLVEDDIVPPADALYQLFDGLGYGDAAVAGCVLSRFRHKPTAWRMLSLDPWKLEETDEPNEEQLAAAEWNTEAMGQVGGGCLLLKTAALRQVVFRPCAVPPNSWRGWDAALGYDLNHLGWGVHVNWRVRCQHWQKIGEEESWE